MACAFVTVNRSLEQSRQVCMQCAVHTFRTLEAVLAYVMHGALHIAVAAAVGELLGSGVE